MDNMRKICTFLGPPRQAPANVQRRIGHLKNLTALLRLCYRLSFSETISPR